MGLLTDYFAAPSDADAAAVVHRVGGRGSGPASRTPARRGLFRRRSTAAPADPGVTYETVEGGGIEPVVQMGTLEALLTERSYDQVAGSRDGSEFVAARDEGAQVVVRLSEMLTAALADTSDGDLAAAAVPWALAEEFAGEADVDDLADFLSRLATLARQARQDGQAVYCWMSA